MIHVSDTKVTRHYGKFFINFIDKFENITATLEKLNNQY